MSGIIPFDYETNAVRVVMIDDEPWFVAADVCRVLAHTNPTVALSRLDDDEKQRLDPKVWLGSSVAGGGAQTINVVSESGLFALILTSNKPEAKRFRKWVTAEVLPAIRQNGAYAVPRQQLAELELKREYYRSLPEDQKARADRKAVAVRRVNELVSEGYRRRDAIDIVAEEAGMGARTIWAARRPVSSHRCRVILLNGERSSDGLLSSNPAFSDWMMGWPPGWTDPMRPVTGWSHWLQRARGAC